MYLLDGSVVTSASDLKKASECEFAFLRELDVKLGRDHALRSRAGDAMLERAGQLGDEHEHRVLERYRAEFGDAVVEIERPDVRDADALAAAVARDLAALESGAAGRLPGHVRRRRASSASPTSSCASPTAATWCKTPSSPAARASPRCCSSPPTPSSSSASASRDRRHGRTAARRRHASGHRLDDIAPGLPQPRRDAAARRSSPTASPTPARSAGATRATPRRPLPDLRARGAGAPRRAAGRPACGSRQRDAPRGCRHPDHRRARGTPTGPVAGIARRHARRAARAGPAAARGRGAARHREPRAPLTRRSAAAAPVTVREPRARRDPRARRRRHLLRLRGRPALHRGRRHPTGGSTTCSGMVDTRRARSPPFWAHTFAEEREALRAVPRRTSPRVGRRTRTCTSTTTPRYERTHLLRARRAPRRRRGRRRPAAARRRARRPLPDRPQARGAGGQPVVLDQEARAALHGRRAARRRGHQRGADSITEYARRDCDLGDIRRRSPAAAAQHARRDRRLQPSTTASRRCGCATGCSASPARAASGPCRVAARRAARLPARSRAVPARRGPAATRRRPADPDRDRRPDRARARRGRASTTTGARHKTFWWGALRPRRCSRSRSGRTTATCSWSTRSRSAMTQGWYREDQHRVDRRESAAARARRARARGSRAGSRAVRALRLAGAVPARRALRPGPARRSTPCGVLEVVDDGLLVEERSVAGCTWSDAADGPRARRRRPPAASATAIARVGAGSVDAATRAWPRNPADRHPAPHRRRARATAGGLAPARRPSTTTCRRSSPACSASTTPTSPCRARPAPARPTSRRT